MDLTFAWPAKRAAKILTSKIPSNSIECERLHSEINWLLCLLRSGSRRRTYSDIRSSLREYREKLVKRWRSFL